MLFEIIQLGLLVIFGIIAGLTDLKHHKIYNWMNLLALFSGLLVHGVYGGAVSILTGSIPGLLAGLLLLLPFYAVGGMSAGDVKYMGACGSIIGIGGMLPAIGFTLVLGSVLAVSFTVYTQGAASLRLRFKTLLMAVYQMLSGTAAKDTVMPVLNRTSDGRRLNPEDSFPYAISIGLGSVAAQVYLMDQAGIL